MRQDLVNALVAACPQAFRDLGGDPFHNPLAKGVQCQDGWYHLLLNLCKVLQHELDTYPEPEFRFEQLKEKFGDLRVYHSGTGNARIQQLLDRARAESRTTCELCGVIAARIKNSSGRLQCLCSTCERRTPRRM